VKAWRQKKKTKRKIGGRDHFKNYFAGGRRVCRPFEMFAAQRRQTVYFHFKQSNFKNFKNPNLGIRSRALA
jgi:hypothetical protein